MNKLAPYIRRAKQATELLRLQTERDERIQADIATVEDYESLQYEIELRRELQLKLLNGLL